MTFPPVEWASPEGLLAIGGNLEIESLKQAYQNGIFPWPNDDFPLLWFAPPQRAVLFFNELKIRKRLHRELKQKSFVFDINRNFTQVIRHCAGSPTRKSVGTWISPDIIQAYEKFHLAGYAHSFECYNGAGQLVGGLYGVSMGRMFAAESMFFLESGASKATLLFLIAFLAEQGLSWLDAQVISPLLQSFGARNIPRSKFQFLLKKSLQKPALDFSRAPQGENISSVMKKLMTLTSSRD